MLTLPEHLLLIALHDSRGTVHPAAFLALDIGLRAAVLCELRLQGRVQTSASGHMRRNPEGYKATRFPVLDRAMTILAAQPQPGPAKDWLLALESGLPDVREALTQMLVSRGILGQSDKERVGLPGTVTNPMLDQQAEVDMKQRMADALNDGPDRTTARLGSLIALACSCNLVSAAFETTQQQDANDRADWVAERDAIVRALREVVAQTEGTWN
jgi:hypothetical protein